MRWSDALSQRQPWAERSLPSARTPQAGRLIIKAPAPKAFSSTFIDLSTVTAFCEGRERVSPTTLVDISRVLNVPLSTLFVDTLRGLANGASTAKKT